MTGWFCSEASVSGSADDRSQERDDAAALSVSTDFAFDARSRSPSDHQLFALPFATSTWREKSKNFWHESADCCQSCRPTDG